jgi:hypothetical protein
MPRSPLLACSLIILLTAGGCAGGAAAGGAEGSASTAPSRPLAALVAQRIVVAPVHRVAEGDALGWAAAIPRQRDWMRGLDSAITLELGARGLARAWVYPDALVRAYERNPAFAPDPHRLAAGPLVGVAKIDNEQRLPDPLASQLRTLVAMHDGRFVLLPIQVTFEAAPEGGGRAVLRVALLDARAAEVTWLGDVRSDVFPQFTPGVAVSLATRLADLIAAP